MTQAPENPTHLDRIQSFSARYILNGDFTGEICFVDPNCFEDPACNAEPRPIQVGIPTTMEYCGEDSDSFPAPMQACYTAQPAWINGLLRSVRQTRACDACYTISSYYTYLESKRVETQAFHGDNLVSALGTLSQFYLALSPAMAFFIVDTTQKIRGPIEGDNALAELRALAQAGGSDLYVQVGGALEMTRWKDHQSLTDLIIPSGFIYTAERAEYLAGETTQVRANGATISQIECGDRVLSTSNGDPAQTCTFAYSGIKTPSVDVTFSELLGTKSDALSSTVNLSSNVTNVLPGSDADKENVQQGSFDQEIGNADGSYIDNMGIFFDSVITGPLRNSRDEFVYGYRSTDTFSGSYAGSRSWFNILPNILQDNFPTPFSLFGYGAFGSDAFINPLFGRQSDEQRGLTNSQCSTFAVPCSISDNNTGVSEEVITNKYLYKKEDLFRLAARRMQEIILARNTWNVSLPYMPCIRLNQVIEFIVPPATKAIQRDSPVDGGCPPKAVKGIVGGIDVRYQSSKDGKAAKCPVEMRITVMDCSCLGQTLIQSGDLMENECAGEGGDVLSPWQTSQLGIDGQASQVSNTLSLFAAGQANAFAYYNHTCASPGFYTVDFDYENIQGGRPLQLAGAISGPLSGSGHYTNSFNIASSSFQLNFSIGGTGSPTYWRVSNIRLTKKIVI